MQFCPAGYARFFIFALCFAAVVATAEDWHIEDTGQPYYDAEFTVNEGTWMSVDVSPDGKSLVFDLLGDIYRIPAAGGEATLLRGGPAVQRMPSFSPDGSKILYISDADGSDNIWVSDTDGANARRITQENTDMLTSPTWGASGEYIIATKLFADFAKVRSSEIRLFHLQGGAGHLVVETPPNHEIVNEADLSGDGRYLYYTEKVTPPSIYVDANHMNFAVKRRDMHSGATDTVAEGFGGAITPQISPDGKRLAFIRRVKEKTVLFVYDVETAEQRPVYDNLDRDLQAEFIPQGTYYPQYDWFPDNRHVAIWGKGKLYKIDMETGAAQEIPFTLTSRHRYTKVPQVRQELAPERIQVKTAQDLAFSPDRHQFVFTALGSLWQSDLRRMKPKRLVEARGLVSEPAYSADGRYIAYVEWKDEQGSSLKLITAQGKALKTVVSSNGVIRQPAFSSDGNKLVYHIDAGDKCMGGFPVQSGIYWVDVKSGQQHFVTAGGESNFVTETGPNPRFSPDGQRIYYSYISKDDKTAHYGYEARYSRIESIRLDGTGRILHARSAGTDILELTLSNDRRWLAFKEHQQYYLMPYQEAGTPVEVSSRAAFPVAKLSQEGGYEITWSADSTRVYWMYGGYLKWADAPGHISGQATLPAGEVALNLQVEADTPRGTLAFRGARIITMRGEQIIENGTLVVTGNKITAVGSAQEITIPKAAKIIDVTGKTIMPGLVNMHGHIEECYYDSAGIPAQKQPSHFASLAFGITTNFDPYASELPSYAMAEKQKAGVITAPRLVSTGSVIYGRAGKVDASYVPINSYEDALRLMQRKKALGGNVIKSYRQPKRSQRQQLVKAGRETGVLVDAEGESHFYYDLSMILDGHMALEHNLPLANYYDDLIQLMAHGKTANTPTLNVTFGEIAGENYLYQTTRAWEDPKVKTYLPKSVSSYSPVGAPGAAPLHVRGMTTLHAAEEIWDIGFRSVARSTRKLDEAGVTINAGSHGQIQGLGLHWEMWLLAEGGMSAHRVLRTATMNGAKTLGVSDQIGSIETGKLADLIVLDNNPLENIRNTNSVRYTLINGRLYDAYSMNQIGNYEIKRSKFYWEQQNNNGIEWNKAWGRE